VLGVDYYWESEEKILSRFCRMGKLICPDDDNDYSVAAKLAYQIISRAVEVLVDSESRAGFHPRWGLKPLPCAKRR
jgi:DnaJ-class molecular chaperone